MTQHLTAAELERWRDAGAPEDRERVTGHLAECDACGAACAAILDTTPREAAQREDARAFVERGLALGPARWRRVRSAPVLALAAAVAAIAVSLVLLPALRQAPPSAAPDPGEIRGSALLLVAPAGDVPHVPSELVWRSPLHASSFRVEIRDGAGAVLTLTASGERLSLPADLRARLQPDVRYEWTVTALDERGDPLLSPQGATFRILPPVPSR